MPFDVQGRELRYRFPFHGLVDVLVPEGEDAYAGTSYRAAIQAYVHRLENAGLKVILELHWSAPGNDACAGPNGGRKCGVNVASANILGRPSVMDTG